MEGGSAINGNKTKQPAFFFGLQMELVGLAFHLSWLFLFMYSAIPVGSESAIARDANSFSPLYLLSSLALIVTLLVFVFARKRLTRRLGHPALTVAGIVLTCAGTAFYYGTALALPAALFAASQLSGVLTGIGSGILAIRWAWNFGGVHSATIMASTPSILAVTVVCSVTVPHLPAIAAAALISLLPLGSGLFALRVSRTTDASSLPDKAGSPIAPEATTGRTTDRPVRPAPFFTLLCGGIAVLGLALGITVESSTPLFAMDSKTIFLVSAAAAIFIGSGLVIARTPEASFSANLLVPLVVIVCFLVILASTQPQHLAQNIEAVGNLCLEMLFFAVLVVAARRFAMAPVTVFAAGRMTYALSNMAGTLLIGHIAASGSADSVVQLSSFALLMGIEVIMVAAVVVVVLPRRVSFADSATATLEAETPIAAEAPAEEATVATPKNAPFQERVAAFSRENRLTAREEEVAKQLLMGHSYARIMQELCIAEGTVNYHARNIYAKAGVHSKQELIELFEDR